MELSSSNPWLRARGPDHFNNLANKAGEGTQTDAEAAQWFAYSELVDWQEFSARSSSFKEDRWVAYWRAKREAALQEAEQAWQAERRAALRWEKANQQPD